MGPIHPDEDTNVAMNDEDRLYFPGSFASQDQYETVRPFSKNTFNDADVASRYLTSDKFREFWAQGKVPIDQESAFAYRINTGENPWFPNQNPNKIKDYKSVFEQEKQKLIKGEETVAKRAETQFDDYWKAKNAGKQVSLFDEPALFEGRRQDFIDKEVGVYRSVKSKRVTAVQNAARVEGRFFTPLVQALEGQRFNPSSNTPSSIDFDLPYWAQSSSVIPKQDPLEFYLNASASANWRGRAGPYGRPISLLINDNLHNYQLRGNAFGLPNPPGALEPDLFYDITSGNNANDLAKKYGLKLGSAVSTNPEQEIFVPKTLAATARKVGRVVDLPSDKAEIQIWGPPKVNPKVQVLNNAARITGNALGAVGMIPDIGRLAFGGGDIAIGPDGMPYVASSQEMNARNMAPREGTPAEAMWTPETDEENKQRMAQLQEKDKQAKEERELRKRAYDVMVKTKDVEESINSSPFWNTFK